MPEIALRGITKTFPGVRAVDGVSVNFHAGEIHALLGENGAGKSTLMHIVSGLYQPDAGDIQVNGQSQVFSSPRAALAAGIAMVHQHFMLIPTLTVAENILLALPGQGHNIVRRKIVRQQVLQLVRRYDIDIGDPDVQVAALSVGAQQRVEVLKALAGEAHTLILDEPTAVLTPAEVENLFTTLRRLTRAGYLIILITHKIPEVLAVSDRLTVLRRGQVVLSRETVSCTADELTRAMIEEPLTIAPLPAAADQHTARVQQQFGSSLLSLENVSVSNDRGQEVLAAVSCTLHEGEIMGIAGVDGNGQAELAELLIGLRPPTYGVICLRDQPLINFTAANLRAAGIALIPHDRRREGLALTMAIEENLLLNIHLLTTLTAGFRLPPPLVHSFAEEQLARFRIRTPSPTQPVSSLSGGNQQRVIIARELSTHPQVIIAANPSRGLDVAATAYVHQAVRECCQRGAGVVLISTDLDEILTLSTQVYVLYHKQLLGPVAPTVSPTYLGRMMTGAWTPS